jgi:TRAP-type mannitol/chloroaromatic compound transport system permease small subunit
MTGLLRIAGAIDGLSRRAAWIAAWLVLLSCLISAGNAASRYLFSVSSNAWLEIQWQMFAGIFLLGAPWVLKLNEHVRVDLVYSGVSARAKLWIDILGLTFFFLPTILVIGLLGWSFFLASYAGNEQSSNAGGLPLWPVKGLLPFGFALLLLQGLAELVRRVAALRGLTDAAPEYERPLQ